MTNSELKKLAWDIADGKVFGSWMITDEKYLPLVFLPLLFGQEKFPEAASLYEYHAKAGPKKLPNGYPNFATCCFLTKDEVETIRPLIEQANQMRTQFLES